MAITKDQYYGCLLGLASGDALGAAYEGGPVERLLWRLIGHTAQGEKRWTDDTQMSLDLAGSLLACKGLDENDLAQRFASSYRWSRGYGPSTAKLLKRIRCGEDWQHAARAIYPQGSYGNGAAMRAAVLVLYYAGDEAEMLRATRASSRITHAHPLGVEGALLIATATHALLHQKSIPEVMHRVSAVSESASMRERLHIAQTWLQQNAEPAPGEIVSRLGNGMTAVESCVTSVFVALRFLDRDFDAMLRLLIRCGGDVDTLASMAGALWGARNGAQHLPAFALESREQITLIADQLFRQASLED